MVFVIVCCCDWWVYLNRKVLSFFFILWLLNENTFAHVSSKYEERKKSISHKIPFAFDDYWMPCVINEETYGDNHNSWWNHLGVTYWKMHVYTCNQIQIILEKMKMLMVYCYELKMCLVIWMQYKLICKIWPTCLYYNTFAFSLRIYLYLIESNSLNLLFSLKVVVQSYFSSVPRKKFKK
jgi:hypothetical protein